MRRSPALLVASLLLLATGLALLRLASDLVEPPPSRPGQTDAAAVELVRRFYAAADVLLATGDAASLEALVAPDLVEHPPRLGRASGRAGLVAALRARRGAFPGLRLIVDDVQAGDGDRVTAFVRVDGTTGGSFLGLPLPRESVSWGPLEVFRVDRGRIAERWGSGPDPAAFAPLWEGAFDAVRPADVGLGRVDLTVEHIELRPGARWVPPPDGGTRVLLVEYGTLVVEMSGTAGDVLRSGDAVVAEADPGSAFVVPAENSEAAAILVISIAATLERDFTGIDAGVVDAGAATPTAMPGAARRVRASARGLAVAPGARLAVGRAVFAPGHGQTLDELRGSVLLAIEEGTIRLVAAGGTGVVGLEIGEGALVAEGETAWWSASGPTPEPSSS